MEAKDGRSRKTNEEDKDSDKRGARDMAEKDDGEEKEKVIGEENTRQTGCGYRQHLPKTVRWEDEKVGMTAETNFS
jgi:hypothetical protein